MYIHGSEVIDDLAQSEADALATTADMPGADRLVEIGFRHAAPIHISQDIADVEFLAPANEPSESLCRCA